MKNTNRNTSLSPLQRYYLKSELKSETEPATEGAQQMHFRQTTSKCQNRKRPVRLQEPRSEQNKVGLAS